MSNHCLTYQPGMEDIGTEILEQVLIQVNAYSPDSYTIEDVQAALNKEQRDFHDLAALLAPIADSFLESMAVQAKAETNRYFGNNISLYTPLYIANYCVNHCSYCGFSCKNHIRRGKLTLEEIRLELEAIAATGLDEVLLLTGEDRKHSDLEYIGEAVKLATQIIGAVGLEIYPLNTDEYALLHECGADFVSVYQETYDIVIYDKVHPVGPKRSYPYRFNAQERAIRGGMRGVSFGALLGLSDFRRDALAAGLHAYLLQQKYPHAEVSFSVPRLRAFQNNPQGGVSNMTERQLLQVMLAFRLFMPFAGITISTRERASFRDHVLGLCATRMSAGVSVGVGGYDAEVKSDKQFEIADGRSVNEIHRIIINRGLQPVYTDYIRGD
jgi:2-iminoacetate synthase